ncbi:MAG TPA: PIN domain-containing protein [Thermodesulfobacteriota bacterium]|jgi:predicted nucleic acid-binding protein
MSEIFLDSNILLRHLLQDDPLQSPKATSFLYRVENRELQVHISELVIFETVFTLQRSYKQPKSKIREILIPLIFLHRVLLSGRRMWKRTFDLYVDLNLPFADAYHVVFMEKLKLTEIATFDTHFDRVSGIKRIDL